MPMKTVTLLKIYMKAQECTSHKKAKKLIKKADKKFKRISLLNDH